MTTAVVAGFALLSVGIVGFHLEAWLATGGGGRVGTPEDIAWPIVFLCSEWARHINGEILNVNGGSVLCG